MGSATIHRGCEGRCVVPFGLSCTSALTNLAKSFDGNLEWPVLMLDSRTGLRFFFLHYACCAARVRWVTWLLQLKQTDVLEVIAPRLPTSGLPQFMLPPLAIVPRVVYLSLKNTVRGGMVLEGPFSILLRSISRNFLYRALCPPIPHWKRSVVLIVCLSIDQTRWYLLEHITKSVGEATFYIL